MIADPAQITKSIGIFDSGIGGLTVLAKVKKILPHENLIYLGDTARVPYGTKSKSTIERFAMEDVDFLLQHNVKLVIAACNTVSALALPYLREHINTPILGVIEPAVQTAIQCTKNHRIGIIGTRSTVLSRAYETTFHQTAPSIEVLSVACPLLVSLIEENWLDEPETHSIVQKYLAPLREANIDTLILGCTHYPLLRPVIQKFMGPTVTLVDSAYSTALACAEMLVSPNGDHRLQSQAKPSHRFFVTDEPQHFQEKGQNFLGHPIPRVEHVQLVLSRATPARQFVGGKHESRETTFI